MRQVLRALLLLATAACAYVTPAAAQQGSIIGRVTSADGTQTLVNANVHAVVAGSRVAARTLTNTDGRYRLTVAPGTYALHVEMVGYEAFVREGVDVTANGVVTVDVSLPQAVFQLNPVVASASKRQEKATEAPALVGTVSERDIVARPTVTPVEHLRGTVGVDIVTSGVQSTNVVVRGFNNIFSGALHTLTDHRIAGVPSLQVNLMHFIPAGNEDLERMEVVLGPGSALYGPNTAKGVLHMITRSPLLDQGTTVAVTAGEQSLFQGAFRTAHKLSDRFGFKLSGQYMRADEWGYTDPIEVAERQKFINDTLQANPNRGFFRRDLRNALQIDSAEAERRISLVGTRDNDVERFGGEARADWRATDELSLVFQGGMTMVGNGIELTGLGAGQAKDWRYSYLQTRANWRRLFTQVYLNASDAGDTYLLRNGAPIVDKSTLLVGQVQHGFDLAGWQTFTYGVDYLRTTPRTEGTINGVYEDDDETTQVGAYLQSQTALTRKLDLVLAGRVDDHSGLPDLLFSPRAGLVYKLTENQAFRATFNRAYSTPSSLNQFLDLGSALPEVNAAALGYSIRVRGTGTEGFRFGDFGTYQMRSPLPGAPTSAIDARATGLWAQTMGLVLARAAQGGTVLPPALVQYLTGLQPTEAEIPTVYRHPATGATGALATLDIPDVDPVRETTTTTLEVGYRGALGNRLMLAAGAWWERQEDFVTPLTFTTPLLFHAPDQTIAYVTQALLPALTQFYMGQGMPAQMAQDTAQKYSVVYGNALGGGVAQVPVGVITPLNSTIPGAQLLMTYYNVEDELDLNGADFAATYLLTRNLSLGGTLSVVNKDLFKTKQGESVTLNAPKLKWAGTATYRNPDWGVDTELRVRYNDGFPVRSGVYNGTLCIGGEEPGAEDCVDSFTLFDLNVSYRLPNMRGATLQAYVQNLTDEKYRSFPGVPNIGRMALLRLRYTF